MTKATPVTSGKNSVMISHATLRNFALKNGSEKVGSDFYPVLQRGIMNDCEDIVQNAYQFMLHRSRGHHRTVMRRDVEAALRRKNVKFYD